MLPLKNKIYQCRRLLDTKFNMFEEKQTLLLCEVVNTEDKKPMTLNIEWLDDDVKIVILRPGMAPLTGQVFKVARITTTTITKLCAGSPGKTLEESVEVYRNELSGKDKDVQFNLNDSRLLWKKKIWKRGTIEVKPLDNIVFLVDLSLQWLKQCGSLQDTTKKLREDNELLEKRSQQLVAQMKEMERVKITMEDALYKQFLLLLNSKKRRIRELEELSKSQSVTLNRSAYDVSTDDSDAEPEEATRKKRKKAKPEPVESPVASTSKRSSVSPLKPSPDSDEDIVLRYDESQQVTSNLNVLEEDTEDDLFSQ